MARVKIDNDEVYPFYRLDLKYGGLDATIADQTLERWNRVMAEFWVVQGEMEGVHTRAVASLPPRPDRSRKIQHRPEVLKTVEYVCLATDCGFKTLDMTEAHKHENEAPPPFEHLVIMETKVMP